ncbi:MAG: corrinoid protein [Bacillota bacterium]|jgi:5-methyltetrahydrofolate--homocysteine methyltransferase|nr:cobalamin-binding protein [Bacillota bacterium]HOB91698.1 corrinoid protein [Bacillota bacterium]HPZ54566.1 corrinoid protein [Bacillota bacterium]HQD18364.1 corrinoid protein [Bacillota bacterium]
MADFKEMQDALIAGNAAKVKELAESAVAEGVSAVDILNQGLIPGMAVIGERFKKNEVYVPEVLIAARAMKTGLAVVKPLLAESNVEPIGKVVIGTVKGDLHDIGKNLVAMMLEGAGFEVIDAGVDVPPEKFSSLAKETNAKLIGLSALLTTTMPAMKDTLDRLEADGLRDEVKVMIGGAPVTQKYADEIGADGYAPDASSAVDLAKDLLGIA